MSASAPTKFNFDVDMGATRVSQHIISDADLDARLKSATEQGYKKGFAEGEQSSTAKSTKDLANAVEALVQKTGNALNQAQDLHEKKMEDAVSLAVSVAAKLSANLIVRYPLDSIHALMAECLTSLDNAPHLVIRCHPELADAVQTLAAEKIKTSGFQGRLVVMGEPEIGIGDARFEWTDGGIKRDVESISAQISEKIKMFMGPRTAPEPEPAHEMTEPTHE